MIIKKVFILGAGGFGREVYEWLSDWCAVNNGWEVGGFINDDLNALDGFDGLPPIVSRINEYSPSDNSFVVCAIGNPQDKKKVVELLIARGVEFFTLKHPTAVVGGRVKLGNGVVICPYAVLTTNITIGDFVMLNVASSVGHDVCIGDYSTLSGHCDVTGGVTLDDCVFMGSHAVVLPKAHVGAHACIGAGSVVLKRVAPYTTVFGIPAKRISD